MTSKEKKKEKIIKFINNANIDGFCLNRGKLNLNRKDSSLLAKKYSLICKIEGRLILRVQ